MRWSTDCAIRDHIRLGSGLRSPSVLRRVNRRLLVGSSGPLLKALSEQCGSRQLVLIADANEPQIES